MVSTDRNINIKAERKKALFQYCFVCIIFFLIGVIISSFVGEGALLDMGEQIKLHFLGSFSKNAPLYNFVVSVFHYSIIDIICVISAFLFTFSIFNYIQSDIVLAYQGFCVGFSISVLFRYSSLFNFISQFNILWFVVFKIIMLVFFVIYLNTLTKYSFELKTYSAKLRARLDPKTLLYISIFMISGCGFVLLFNSIYCIGIIII